MNNNGKSKEQLIQELEDFRRKITELEKSETERKQAEEKLRASEQYLDSILKGITDAVFTISPDFKILWANKAALEQVGKKLEELIGQYCYFITHHNMEPCSSENDICPLKEAIITGGLAKTIHKHFDSLGNEIFVEIVVYPFKDKEGRITQFIHMSHDTTERKRAEEALRESHDELEERVHERTAELAQRNEELTMEIAERLKMEQTLRESKEQLRVLASKILSTQENERKRIALEVHDVLGSSLSAIKFKAEEALHLLPKDKTMNISISKSLETLITLIQDTIGEARRIQADLRPSLLDDLGIVATLSWFCRRFETIYSNIRVEQEATIGEDEVPEYLKIVLFRITQEAMNNIGKHAKGDSVYLVLRKVDGFIELCIKDNGEGFDLEALSSRKSLKKGLGLSSMKERVEFSGGSFSIESAKGKGTVIKAVWLV